MMQTGGNHNIPHLWAFMLLGQIVAISFASNLSFVAMLVYGRDSDGASSKTQHGSSPRRRMSDKLILTVNLVLTLLLVANLGGPWFMYLLLAPHVLAFAPLLRDVAAPSSEPVAAPSTFEQLGLMAVLVAAATKQVLDQGGGWQVILRTLYEHPAVSSVGWDVICCWVSYTAWVLLGVS